MITLNLSSNQFQEFPSVLESLDLDYGVGKLNLNNNPYNRSSPSSPLPFVFGIFIFGPSLIVFFILFFLGAIVIKLRQSQKQKNKHP